MNNTGQWQKLVLRKLVLPASIGIYDEERAQKQRLEISIEADIAADAWAQNDDISTAIDYDFLRREVVALVNARHYDLQETLCDAIIAECFAKDAVQAVRVQMMKLDIYPDCDAIGIDIFRKKDH